MTSSRPTVAVVGGGVLGVSAARHLAREGAEVVLVTEGRLGSDASGRSLSWLNSAGEREEDYHRLRMAGIDRYRTLAFAHPDADWLRFDGGLTWETADRADELRAVLQAEQARGYDSVWLRPNELADHVPGVNVSLVPATGAVWNPGEGWVDLPSLIHVLAGELVDFGGEIIAGAGPAAVHLEHGRVAEVRMADGRRLPVDAALLATGAGVPRAVAEFGVVIPEVTQVSLLVRTKPAGTSLRAVLNTPRAAVRPAPGGTLCVDSDWTSSRVVVGEDGSFDVPVEVVEQLLSEASQLLAGTPTLIADSYGIGHKPIPGDGAPVLGALEEVPGLHVAFTHSGATLGLIVGELLAREIVTGQPSPLLATFRAARFRE